MIVLRHRSERKYQFDSKTGNAFELLVDGRQFYPQMLAALRSAQQLVLLEQYLVKSSQVFDQFIHALVNAAQRGVGVYLLLDDYGSAGLQAKDRNRLVAAGVQLVFYNPVRIKHFHRSLFRNHRKLLIVDNRQAFVGGAGFTDDFNHLSKGRLAWHDVMLEIKGPMVSDWMTLFTRTWQHCTDQSIQHDLSPPKTYSENQTGRILRSAPFRGQEINRALLGQIKKARHRIWITTPYFVASHKIRRYLQQAARRGIDVRLLFPGPHSDIPWISFAARRHYMRLLRSGARIFEYQPRFTHSKIELCDDWVSLGSSNLDRWNQRWNLDANQAIHDIRFTQQIVDYFQHDFTKSEEITLQAWQQRPWRVRLREYIAGRMVFWIERLSRYFQERKK